jgi:predicted nucleic acid-binding protein
VAIKNHKIKNHTILIDDVRMFNTIEWNNIGHDNVIKLIMEINENYKISYYDSPHGNNDILLAKI